MLLLWPFGLVVEGKLGWQKTLAVFLGVGVVQCAIEQLFMLGASGGGSDGASAVLLGLMAMSLVWAPENEIRFVTVRLAWLKWYDFQIGWVVTVVAGFQLFIWAVARVGIGAVVLHFIGAALGFAVAVWMLKTNRVDCENWDIFSIHAGRQSLLPSEWREKEEKERAEEQQQQLPQRREEALEEIRQSIADRRPTAALKLHQIMAADLPDWTLSEPDLFDLIGSLSKEQLWTESVALARQYLSQYSQRAALVRLNLAQILLVKERRPAAALKVLAKLDPAALDPAREQFLGQLRAKAEQLRGEDSYELSDEEW